MVKLQTNKIKSRLKTVKLTNLGEIKNIGIKNIPKLAMHFKSIPLKASICSIILSSLSSILLIIKHLLAGILQVFPVFLLLLFLNPLLPF